MNRIDNSGQGIAKLGRDGDRYMAHVTKGEMVVPPEPIITPETKAKIMQEMRAAGLSPDEYTVGDGMSINPITGQPEFGWLKKTFKSIKKVAKKVAPVAMLIPGVGTALGGVLGGLGGGIGSALGLKGTLAKSVLGGIGGLGIPGLSSIAGGAAGGFNSFKGLGSLSGMLKGGPLSGFFGGQQVPEGLEPYSDAEIDEMLNTMDPSVVQQMVNQRNDEIEYNLMTDGDSLLDDNYGANKKNKFNGLFGPGSIADKLFNVDPSKGTGPFSFLTGGNKGGGLFGGGGGNMGAAGIAALLGKTVYDAAKERQGGLALTPAVTMDSLGRYSLANALGTGGTREEFGLGPKPSSLKFAYGGPVQHFSKGGAAMKELDMRNGGESAGPGTGTSDDIPAMLSDGEFVMTAKATRGAGAFNMNKTKSGIELIKGGKASREKGVKNMRELMNIFEAI